MDPVPLMYLPLTHVVHAAAADPTYLPTPQSAQAALLEEPSSGLLLPAKQSIHVVEPASTLYLPIPQSTQAVSASEPVLTVVFPASQLTHCVLPVTPFHLPGGHVSHALPSPVTPSPESQLKLDMQPVCSAFAKGATLAHALQDAWPGVSVYVAPSHMVQTALVSASARYVPRRQLVQSSAES